MPPDASPTARALLALELIQSSPGVTADRLGARLGVTERAARRYVGILREAGIPIDSVRGPYGGYRVGRGLRLPPMVFSATEALGLVMAALDGHHAASDPTDPVGRALGKLIRALPEPVAAHAETVRRTTAPAPDRAAARPDPDTTAALVAACSSHRTVRLDYRTEAGSEWVVDIEPWTVVVRHGRWYVVGRSLQHGQTRTYRIDRVRRVDLLGATFHPPGGLDPVALLEEHLAVGWEYDAQVDIAASLDEAGRWLPRTLGRLERLDDEATRLVGSTSNPAWYAQQLAILPVPYRIRGGPELRAAAAEVAKRMKAAVERTSEAEG
jgi:predicted DNA-binding transcriptional regulator YafY